MTLCFLALGSNRGTPQKQLRQAIETIRQWPKTRITNVASLYKSHAWGRKVQPGFFNTVLAIQTQLPPERLLLQCQNLEKKQGRVRHLKWGARTLDIDILLYGSKTINTPTLSIPHPYLLHRDFVLIPLLEIAPKTCMPDGNSIAEISSDLMQTTTVHLHKI